jgi:hypothetical protein
MAQTRTKSGGNTRSRRTTSRSNGSQARSRSTGRRNDSRGGPQSTRARSRQRPSGKSAATTTRSTAQTRSDAGAQGATERLGRIASKAKTPLLAGGAAVAGLVGGIALSRNGAVKGLQIPKSGRRRKKVSMPNLSMPNVSMPKLGGRESMTKALGATAKALGNTAVEVGKTGYRIGELTSEVRRVRERVSDD